MLKATQVAAYLVKKVWLLLALLLVLFAVLLSALRYALPHLDHKKHLLEDYVNEQYGVNLTIGSVHAVWQSAGPSIVLNDVALAQDASSPVALNIEQIYVEVDFWQSIAQRMLSSKRFDLINLELDVDGDRFENASDGDFPVVSALKSLFLDQLQSFSLQQGQVKLTKNGHQQVFDLEALSWRNQDKRHQGQGTVQVQSLANDTASFVIDLHGDKDDLNGVMYAKAEELDISPWVSEWLQTKRALSESRANFEVWGEVEHGEMAAVNMLFHDSLMKWGSDNGKTLQTGIRGGAIQALPNQNGWNVRVDQLVFDSNQHTLVTDLVGQVSNSGDVLVNTVKPVSVKPFLALLPLFTDENTDDEFAALEPDGQLATLQFQWKAHGPELAAKLFDVSWKQLNSLPGADGVDVDVYWYKNHGVLSVHGDQTELAIDNLLPEDITLASLDANIYLYPQKGENGDQWIVLAPDIAVNSDPLSFTQSIRYDFSAGELSLIANIADRPLADVGKLFPAPLMGSGTTAYLNSAFVGPGQITNARVIWQGKPANFPFNDNQGVFQAFVDVKQSHFQFSQSWPTLTDLDLFLEFENASLDMHSPAAKLMDVWVRDLKARIPTLTSDAVLTIDAQGGGTGAQLAALMQASSLSDSLGKILSHDVQVSGPLQASLNLAIPLDSDKVVATGDVTLTDNDVYVQSTDMTFANTSGNVHFKNEAINADNLTANWLGQALNIELLGGQNDDAYQVGLALDGHWDVGPLIGDFNPEYETYLFGDTDWQAKVDLRLPKTGFSYTASVSTELKGITSDLPAPFSKTQDISMPLLIKSSGNEQASTLNATLGDNVRFDGVLPHKEMQFSRAHLALGNTDFVGLGVGFSISAALDVVNVPEWYKAIELLVGGIGGNQHSLFTVPERIFINANNLVMAQQKLTDVSITAKQSNNNWMLDINSEQARATVNLYDQWLQRGIEVDADYIRFNSWTADDDQSKRMWNADTLPPVYFHCSHCSVNDIDLGDVTVDVARAEDGMLIRQANAVSKHGKLTASGKWLFAGEQNLTQLQGRLDSKDIGQLLQTYGINSGIKDSGADMKFDLQWPESPMDFALATVNGEVKWSLDDGYLSELSDKGSRIFTLFSLNSLVRKLSLDFRDVFAKGFFYDKMSGTLQIAEGKAATKDTEIDGGAGEIEIKGYTDLVAQKLNYDVSFTPNVTGNLPFLVYFLATPPTALAALALDQVLTSAKVISNVNYKVTGTLNEPVFQEVGRDSKDIALPARNTPQEESKDGGDAKLNDADLEPLNLEVVDG